MKITLRPVLLTIVVIGAFALRLTLVLSHSGYLGVDGGAYILGLSALLGDDPTGAGFPRPPLAPGLLLLPFTSTFGVDIGYKVWSAVAATLPVLAVYLLSRRWLSFKLALLASVLIALDPWQAEMVVTGALPLIGFSLILTAIWLMLELSDMANFRWRWVILLAVTVGTIPYVNQTSAGLAVILLPIALVAMAATSHSGPAWPLKAALAPLVVFPATIGLVGGLLIGLGALPWYWDIRPNSDILHYPGPWVYLVPFGDIAWFQFAAAIGIGVATLKYGRSADVKLAAILTITLGSLLIFLSTDETIINIFYRPRYLVMMLIWPLAIWMIARHRPWPKGLKPSVALASVALLGVAYVWTFERQTVYSDMVTESTAELLLYLRETDPDQGIVTNAFTMALWVAALNKVPSPHPWTWEPPRAYTQTDEHVRCVLGWVDQCDPLASANSLEVGYVLIDHRFPDYNSRAPGNYLAPPNQWLVTAASPWLELVCSRSQTRLWKILKEGETS